MYIIPQPLTNQMHTPFLFDCNFTTNKCEATPFSRGGFRAHAQGATCKERAIVPISVPQLCAKDTQNCDIYNLHH